MKSHSGTEQKKTMVSPTETFRALSISKSQQTENCQPHHKNYDFFYFGNLITSESLVCAHVRICTGKRKLTSYQKKIEPNDWNALTNLLV